MLHRFASPHGKVDAHNPARLRALLEYLRRARIDVVSLDDLVARRLTQSGTRDKANPSVAFTIDDGYRDFAEVGLPVFEAFDCPVTLFVVPGAIEGATWFWWDQVEHAFAQRTSNSFTYELGGKQVVATWRNGTERANVQSELLHRLKAVPDKERRTFMRSLSVLIGVDVPTQAPATYQLLGWNDLRALEQRGVRIGPHTMTHPVLSRCADDVAQHEIMESVRRVAAECKNPSSVFCYPNGRHGDFGTREYTLLERAGMRAAVSAEPGLVPPTLLNGDAHSRWSIPRFNYEEEPGRTARLLFF